jgi:hypothetical protein
MAEMDGTYGRMADRRGSHMVLVRKYKGKKPLGRIRCRWRDNIKIDSSRNLLEGRGVDRYGS